MNTAKRNYDRELRENYMTEDNRGKKLLLHSCCAPCSSYVLMYLRKFYQITVFYYNPNITEQEEYQKRVAEQKRLIHELNQIDDQAYPIEIVEGNYDTARFFEAVRGLEKCPEGQERCFICYTLRLEETAKTAEELHMDYFTTTLTISPLKNADKINEIGERAAKERRAAFLPSDFKKNNGFKQSVELSKTYGLYRQDYCGCVFSHLAKKTDK